MMESGLIFPKQNVLSFISRKSVIMSGGKIVRNAQIRCVRDGVVLWDGKIASLKRFKDDAREVAEGFECGIRLEGFNDLREGDIFEVYETREVERTSLDEQPAAAE